MLKPNRKSFGKSQRKYQSRKSKKYQAMRRQWKQNDIIGARRNQQREEYNPDK
jgi:hypothetical protein